MSSTLYGSAWNSKMRFMIDVITEDQARHRYTHGPWFSVAIGDNLGTDYDEASAARYAGTPLPVPEFSLEVEPGPTFVKTKFYDPYGSILVIYNFRRHDEHTLFLKSLRFYTYPDEPAHYGQSECLVIESLTFHLDGTSRQEINDRSQPTIQIIDRKDVDLTKNFEPIPSFGDWAGLGRADRRPQT